jgi:nitroreductase
MVALASRVPDHGKLAPWRFIIYGDKARQSLGSKFLERARQTRGALSPAEEEIERTRFSRAPAVVAVVSRAAPHVKIPEWEQLMSAGATAYNLLLVANAHGWDAQWLTEWIAYDPELVPALGLKPGERITGFIYIGRKTLPKTERDRPALDSILTEM